MKKKISALLASVMLFSIFTVNGYAVGLDNSNAAYEEFPISAQEGQEILSEFSAEISYVEETFGMSITELDRKTLETLKGIAIQNLNNKDYDFSGLIDMVVLVCEQNRLMNEPAAISEDGITPRGTTTRIVKEFGPISGQVSAMPAVKETESLSVTAAFKIEAGSTLVIDGFEGELQLSGGIDINYNYICSGPSPGTPLLNGKNATNRVFFGVLYGSIVETRYESPVTGEVKIYYTIPSESRYVTPYSVLCSLLTPVYTNNVGDTSIIRFDNLDKFLKAIEENPGVFL